MIYHVFDLDKTLLVRNGSFAFYFHLIKQGIVPRRTLFRTIPLYFCRSRIKFIHTQVFQHVLKGLSYSMLEKQVEKFLEKSLRKLLCPKIASLALAAKCRSEKIMLLSSSPLLLVEKIAKKFSFDACAGTEYAVDKEGRICEITSLITGHRKKEIARAWVKDGEEKVVYTDSLDDLPLLEWADRAIVIRPGTKLKKIALSREWMVL